MLDFGHSCHLIIGGVIPVPEEGEGIAVVVSAAEADDLARVKRALYGLDVRTLTGDSRSFRAFREAECLVIAARRHSLDGELSRLRRVSLEHPLMPIILVTDQAREAALAAASVPFHSIVRMDDVIRELPRHVADAARSTVLDEMIEDVTRAKLPPALSRGLARALEAARDRPYRRLKELAEDVGCHPRTLTNELTMLVGTAYTWTEVLTALRVVRARDLHVVHMTWKQVAGYLRIHPTTLRRSALRWPGCTLNELATRDARKLLRMFQSQYLSPLVQPRVD